MRFSIASQHVIRITAIPWLGQSMLRAEASVYTVHVGKKSAWLMMVVVAFWAAMPALAYLKPAQADACCRQMMQGCGSCDMGASQSCCQVHAPDTSVPLGRATPVERLIPPDAHGCRAGIAGSGGLRRLVLSDI